MKKTAMYFAAFGSAFLIWFGGVLWQTLTPTKILPIIFAAISVVPVLLLVTNLLLAKQYIKKINHTKVADMQGYMLHHRKEAEKTAHILLQKLQRSRHATTVYTIFIWLLAACVSLAGGMLYKMTSLPFYLFVLYAYAIFYVVYIRIRENEPIVLNENALVLQQKDYPLLYDTAYRAAQAMECRGEITILLSLDCNAGIVQSGKNYYLQLGIISLNLLSQEELYCICLHEFSHCAPKNRAIEYEMQYGAWLSSDKELSRFMRFFANLFAYSDIRYLFDHMVYQYATSVMKETEADRDMAKYGCPEVAASALLKFNYDDKFRWERGVLNEEALYAAEKPNPHCLRDHIKQFKQAIEARHEEWDKMVALEILPNNASHPILKMRLETLGVKSAKCIQEENSPAYQDEIEKALEFADKKLFEQQNTYEQDRKEYYLEPLHRVTEWEKNGMPVAAETFADIVSDLRQIGRNEDAEALCERAMQELDVNSSPHAYFIKGCALLHRYDEAGIDLVYHALENNYNYLEEGLEVIGTFCCMTGREKELLEYRERAQMLAQKDKDEYSETGFLAKDDHLSGEHLPDGMLEDILAYIRSIDGDIIQNIYLVRKTISNTFFTSAFVIHFYGGTDTQRNEIMHKIFRYLDTYPVDWQFSLFDYADYSNIKFDKIEGSLVYSKSDSDKK